MRKANLTMCAVYLAVLVVIVLLSGCVQAPLLKEKHKPRKQRYDRETFEQQVSMNKAEQNHTYINNGCLTCENY